MKINDLQSVVNTWINKHGVRYFDPLTNTAILMEEVGELARVMARKYGEQSVKEGETLNLADEIADVMWVLTCIANQTGVDLEQAIADNIDKKSKRDSERHINNEKLYKCER